MLDRDVEQLIRAAQEVVRICYKTDSKEKNHIGWVGYSNLEDRNLIKAAAELFRVVNTYTQP